MGDSGDTDDTTDPETRTVNVPFPLDEHERMRRVKDWNNVSWREVIKRGIGTLESPERQQE